MQRQLRSSGGVIQKFVTGYAVATLMGLVVKFDGADKCKGSRIAKHEIEMLHRNPVAGC